MTQPSKIELSPAESVRGLPHPQGYRVVRIAVGAKREAIRLLVLEDSGNSVFDRTIQPGFASFPTTHAREEHAALLTVSDRAWSSKFHLRGLTATHPLVDLLPDGEILVVAPRCHRFSDGSHELNARVYDENGDVQREFLLGDGIKHVQADRSGNIWVGYFDEGVFGNFGWLSGTPVGASGIVRFNERGEKLWDYQAPSGADPVTDCYALNVSVDAVWAYYYTGFPVVCINRNSGARAWTTNTSGGRALAVDGRRVLLYGGYNPDRTSCRLLQLGDRDADLIGEVSLTLPPEADLASATVIGRDNVLHVFCADDWFTFPLRSIP